MALVRSMRGKEVDMEKLNLKNEELPAVGNAKVNARGDELGAGGKIVRTREEVLSDYYKQNPRAIKEEIVSRKK
jgi:hypothetical protein|tara:strand:- start:485 stop:706 length:222 start_codon:yes stop_codon:yes gene_type:complete